MPLFPVEDGVLVVPVALPFRVSNADLKLTVADWLAQHTLEDVVTPDDEDLKPAAPYMDADVTEFDPDQSWLPQEPGSVVEDENPEEVEGGEVA
ncbi:hypothetical protein [Nonomuraea fuscirosea]|uniref:hypothetical protein n=1 Tax=Nonomuraea fuscirosea TaxID=1291556 RepID=UPI0033EE10E2